MMRRHSQKWLDGWIAYSNIEPFGQQRVDWLFAVQDAAIVNSAGKVYKDTIRPEQFVPSIKEEEEHPLELTPEQHTRRMADALMAMVPGTIDKRKNKW